MTSLPAVPTPPAATKYLRLLEQAIRHDGTRRARVARKS